MRISDWSSDVCSSDLEEAAAKPRKDGDERCAKGQRHQRIDDDAVGRRVSRDVGKITEEHRDREQAKPRDQHAGDGARTEGQRKPALQAGSRRLCSPDGRPPGGGHAGKAGGARESRAITAGKTTGTEA